MSTKFNSVAEAAAQLACAPDSGRRVKREISRNEVVSALLQMRVNKGLTQEDVAKSMKCATSTISRIESGNDRQLKWTDIIGYACALNVQMGIMFDDESLPAAARIKQCVFKIDDDLKKLAELAKQEDPEINQGIARFYKEVLFNFMVKFAGNADKLNSIIKIPKQTAPELPAIPQDCADPALDAKAVAA